VTPIEHPLACEIMFLEVLENEVKMLCPRRSWWDVGIWGIPRTNPSEVGWSSPPLKAANKDPSSLTR
jgi:hypothetical protein